MDTELRLRIDSLEARLNEAISYVTQVSRRIDQILQSPPSPQPRLGPEPVYLSGRWKLRDGNMYGR